MNEAAASRPALGPLSSGVRIVSAFVLVALLSAPYIAICVLLLPWRRLRIRAGNSYGKGIGRIFFALTGIVPDLAQPKRIEALAPALFVCNHSSTMDMWIGMWLCPYRGCGVAKKELIWIPFFGQAYLLSGHLLLDRGNRKRAVASMARAAKVVARHRLSIWMWPEGTRSDDGRLKPLKKGFVHLAIATGLPVVPVVFHDADLRWSPHRLFRLSPGPLRIEILDPIDTKAWKAETATEHAHTVWAAFQGALGSRQQGLPTSPEA